MVTTLQEKKFNPLLRSLSFLIVIVFLTTSLAWAGGVNVFSIKVPEKYGKVKERYKGKNDKVVVHIQDAHTSLDAQKNIGQILESLSAHKEGSNEKALLVGIEGAKGNFETNALKQFPVPQARKIVSDFFLKHGKITGPEYQAIVSDTPLNLYGIEDTELYRQNYSDFMKTINKKDELIGHIEALEDILVTLKSFLYSEKVSQLDNVITSYTSGNISFPEYCSTLIKYASEIGVDFYEYINFSILAESSSYESKIDFNAVNLERDALIERLSEADSDRFNGIVEDFKCGKISESEFYRFLLNTASAMQISGREYVNVSLYSQYLRVSAKLDVTKLILECREIEEVVFSALARTEDEKTLITLSRNIGLMKNFAELKAVNEDVKYLREHRQNFSAEVFVQFIKRVSVLYSIPVTVNSEIYLIDEILPVVDRFYETAEARNAALIDNLVSQTGDADVSALVAGGYHTKGLTEELRKRDISYMVVTPNLVSSDETLPYEARMTQEFMPFDLIIQSAFNTISVARWLCNEPMFQDLNALQDLRLNMVKVLDDISYQVIGEEERTALLSTQSINIQKLHFQEFISLLVIMSLIVKLDSENINNALIDDAIQGLNNEELAAYKHSIKNLGDSGLLEMANNVNLVAHNAIDAELSDLGEAVMLSVKAKSDAEKSIIVRVKDKVFIIDYDTFITNFEKGFVFGATSETAETEHMPAIQAAQVEKVLYARKQLAESLRAVSADNLFSLFRFSLNKQVSGELDLSSLKGVSEIKDTTSLEGEEKPVAFKKWLLSFWSNLGAVFSAKSKFAVLLKAVANSNSRKMVIIKTVAFASLGCLFFATITPVFMTVAAKSSIVSLLSMLGFKAAFAAVTQVLTMSVIAFIVSLFFAEVVFQISSMVFNYFVKRDAPLVADIVLNKKQDLKEKGIRGEALVSHIAMELRNNSTYGNKIKFERSIHFNSSKEEIMEYLDRKSTR